MTSPVGGGMTSGDGTPRVTVVLPCWNEARNLERGVLGEVRDHLAAHHDAWEVVVVDDESSDGSRDLVAAFVDEAEGFRQVVIPHGGKPAAVWAGIQAARGEIVLFADMDQSTPIRELDRLLPWYDRGYDVVIGSRGSAREGTSILRKAGSVAFTTLRQMLFLRNIHDTQCGFKSARREAALAIFPRLRHFSQSGAAEGWKVSAFDVELLHLFTVAGYRVKAVEVEWLNRDESDTKGARGDLSRYVYESVEMAREIFRVRRNQSGGRYDDVRGLASRNPAGRDAS